MTERRRYAAKRWDMMRNEYVYLCLYAYDARDAEHQASYSFGEHTSNGFRRPEHVEVEPYIEAKHGPWVG